MKHLDRQFIAGLDLKMDFPMTAALAATLEQRIARGERFAPLLVEGNRLGVPDAYAVQDALVDLFKKTGAGSQAGFKVGLTNRTVLDRLGAVEPMNGRLLSGRRYPSGATLVANSYVHLGIECEMALRLSRPITARTGPDELLAAIDSVHPAFELIDDRGANLAQLDAASLIAENGWNAGFIIGEGIPMASAGDINSVDAVLYRDGKAVSQGNTADILDGPIGSLAALLASLSQRGEALQAGEWVLTGAILPPLFPLPGSHLRFELAGLQPIEINIR